MKRKLSAEAVATIRVSPESNAVLGRQFGVSKQTISQIRLGITHRLPEVDHLDQSSVGARLCFRCIHWNAAGDGFCSLGFPEAALEGQLAARDCGAFSKQGQP